MSPQRSPVHHELSAVGAEAHRGDGEVRRANDRLIIPEGLASAKQQQATMLVCCLSASQLIGQGCARRVRGATPGPSFKCGHYQMGGLAALGNAAAATGVLRNRKRRSRLVPDSLQSEG